MTKPYARLHLDSHLQWRAHFCGNNATELGHSPLEHGNYPHQQGNSLLAARLAGVGVECQTCCSHGTIDVSRIADRNTRQERLGRRIDHPQAVVSGRLAPVPIDVEPVTVERTGTGHQLRSSPAAFLFAVAIALASNPPVLSPEISSLCAWAKWCQAKAASMALRLPCRSST
ncbi:hypothetical protein D3C85_944580 [compost metagenome]